MIRADLAWDHEWWCDWVDYDLEVTEGTTYELSTREPDEDDEPEPPKRPLGFRLDEAS